MYSNSTIDPFDTHIPLEAIPRKYLLPNLSLVHHVVSVIHYSKLLANKWNTDVINKSTDWSDPLNLHKSEQADLSALRGIWG